MAEIGRDIEKARQLLENGELVAIPTETVYGLAANALNTDAVMKIFLVKERPSFDPLIIHLSSIDHAQTYVSKLPDQAKKLADHFWPGPLTLVLPKKAIVPDVVTSGLDTVGIRCPRHDLTQELISQLDFPLAAPSANPFGYISPTSAQHVNDQLGNRIKYILDGGPCKVGLESTIIGFENNQPVIYRRGGIDDEQIVNVIGPLQSRLASSSNPLAPGQLESHYAPKKRFLLGDVDLLSNGLENQQKGVLRFKDNLKSDRNELYLSASGDLQEAARNLFACLRKLDQMDIEVILAEKVPDVGIGKAINDRLQRAAAK